MSGLVRGAIQRMVPKRPHKPGSHALGARTINRQHWRKAASLERQTVRVSDITPMTGGYLQLAGDPAPVPVPHRIYRPTRATHSYGPR